MGAAFRAFLGLAARGRGGSSPWIWIPSSGDGESKRRLDPPGTAALSCRPIAAPEGGTGASPERAKSTNKRAPVAAATDATTSGGGGRRRGGGIFVRYSNIDTPARSASRQAAIRSRNVSSR